MKIKMYKVLVITMLYLFPVLVSAQEWSGKWISTTLSTSDTVNVWMAFKKEIDFFRKPRKAVARIAADSKYWLYINGEMVVFEGGLKRGPNPKDTYYDEIDLESFFKQGKNDVSVLMWYFGKDGFSHNSSGTAGLYLDIQVDDRLIYTDRSWSAKRMKEFQTAQGAVPNFRLPESNILYDARLASEHWFAKDTDSSYAWAIEKGNVGDAPWGRLVKRPIPLWKDFGIKRFEGKDMKRRGDTLICKLPYNMQFTPFFDIDAKDGQTVKMFTDNYLYYNGSAENIRAEYISKEGRQTYESLGWINGHYFYLVAPEGVKIHTVGYRETGYNTEFAGYFECADPFFNKLWEKARRTLYITMRDTYMDCPDRERAQWTGDAVLEAGEAFYALDTNSHALAHKWLYELIGWQKPNAVLFSPIPAGNWDKELPDQVLASIGYYGIWTYYMHTGDRKILVDLYPAIQRYMALWERDNDGLVALRAGGWQWGDWGTNKDMLLLYNLWYFLSLKGAMLMATELGYTDDVLKFSKEMLRFKTVFNERYWKDNVYRDPNYKNETDERVHALAVLAGIAEPNQFAAVAKVFATQEHASPYMEKYVYEAMYEMGMPVEANIRHKKRFDAMVNNDYFSTLFEGWGIGKAGFGGGTVNHAWSGGGLTVLSSRLCGITPLNPGYTTFLVKPQLGNLSYAKTRVPSIKGNIDIEIKQEKGTTSISLVIPEGTEAYVELPLFSYSSLRLGNEQLLLQGTFNKQLINKYKFDKSSQRFVLGPGNWLLDAE